MRLAGPGGADKGDVLVRVKRRERRNRAEAAEPFPGKLGEVKILVQSQILCD